MIRKTAGYFPDITNNQNLNNLKRRFFTLLFLLLISLGLNAQKINKKSYTLSGYVKDGKTGELLIGATVYPQELPGTGITTNAYGYYSLTLPAGKYHFVVQYLGYQQYVQTIDLNDNIELKPELSETVHNLNDVIILGEKSNKNIVSNDPGEKLDIKEVQSIPVIFGEKDILKTIQLLPGIQPVGEGSSGFYVRGGGTDENLILLDEAPVYNASHLLGFFSTFNSDAVKDIDVYKSGFPAEYGGRLSSVVDVKMNEGNDKTYHVSGGIGIIASRIAFEGPIVKNKGSFIITARRTYADVLSRLYGTLKHDSLLKNTALYFYDINMKANYQITQKDKIYFSCYLGKDVFDFDNLTDFNWGNTTATLRYNHLFSNKLFSNTSFIYSKYSYFIGVGFAAESLNIQSDIQDWNFKEDFNYYLNSSNRIKFGFNSIYHTFVPGKISLSGFATPPPITSVDEKYALENAVYISNEQTINSHLKLTYGLRYSLFSDMGPGSVLTFDSQGNQTDSMHYSNSHIYKNYGGLEPRILVNYIFNDSNSIKLSYARTRQYLHLLSN